ncbi:hypothetical protein BFR45_05845 [Brochothrix thermosphacta]|nr:hypothetical protein BFR45_05845 [Brochothrix thermosphacta]
MLRRNEHTRTVWDGAKASTNPRAIEYQSLEQLSTNPYFKAATYMCGCFLLKSLRIYSLTRIVWVLKLLRRNEHTRIVWVLKLLRRNEHTRIVWVLKLLRRNEHTRTVWDGAKASTNP